VVVAPENAQRFTAGSCAAVVEPVAMLGSHDNKVPDGWLVLG
jgi:hypothetical protein